jgi:predicted HTH domain antitoxin
MGVKITIELPDEIATELSGSGVDISRRVLEAFAIEEFRAGRLSQHQIGRLLGLSRMQTEDFLAQRTALYDFDPIELRREVQTLAKLPKPEETR